VTSLFLVSEIGAKASDKAEKENTWPIANTEITVLTRFVEKTIIMPRSRSCFSTVHTGEPDDRGHGTASPFVLTRFLPGAWNETHERLFYSMACASRDGGNIFQV
jgi:hypothetical protein